MTNPKNWNDTTPAAPAGKLNIKFQAAAPDPDPNVPRNVSAYIEPVTATSPGILPTPPNDATKYFRGDATFASDAIFERTTNKDAASGYAGLDSGSRIKAASFPVLSGDVTTAGGSLSCTVVKVQGTAVKSGMSPSDGDVFTWVAANSRWENLALSALGGANASQLRGVNISSATPIVGVVLTFDGSSWGLKFPRGSRGWIFAGGSGAGQTGATYGLSSSWSNMGSAPTVGVVAAAAGAPGYQKISTGAGVSVNDFGFFDQENAAGTKICTPDSLRYGGFGVLLGQTANCRSWLGFSDGATSGDTSTFAADTPNKNVVGFRYSAGSANWQCVTSTDSSHVTTTDSGIAADTSYHLFDITYDLTSVRFYIDGALVATHTTNIPASTTDLRQFVSVDNKNTANNQFIGLHHGWWTDRWS
jgi:hypothetical protein